MSKEGDYRWMLAKGPPRFRPDGSFAGYISSCIDITDRKKAESELYRLAEIVEASFEFIGLAGLDSSIKYLNRAALKKLGWDNIEGRSILDCIYPEDRDFASQVLPELFKKGSFQHEIRFYNERTGEPFWIQWNAFSIKDAASGEIIALATVSPDITERKNQTLELQNINEEMAAANEELATINDELAQTYANLYQSANKLSESEEKLRPAIETGRMGTWSINPYTLKVSMSDFVKEMLGLPMDKDPEMEDIMQAVHSDYHKSLYATLDNAIKNHLTTDIEYPITNLITGEEKWVKATGRVFLDVNGDAGEYSGIFMDITERKLDELRKNDFIAMVSHELKTPLTSLSAIVQILNAKLKTNQDQFVTFSLSKANVQVKKMGNMINGFLNISRLESGKIQIIKQEFSLNELIDEMVKEIHMSLSSHDITFNCSKSVIINADKDKIASVISNLLSNAVKYSRKDTAIEANCTIVGNNIQVSVADNGIGIMKEDIEKLFTRYHRIESKDTLHISGFGIGLYLSAEIIYRHNGEIWVESEIGKGSTFYFSLPLQSPS